MKRIAYIIIFVSLAYVGCTDLLEENPEGIMAPEGFFETPADVEAAVVGAYAEWVTVQTEKEYLLSLMLRSDMVDIGDRNTRGDRVALNDFSMDANSSLMNNSWIRLYQSISGANTAIQAAREITADDEIKSELEAKARFIRAFTYFHLVRSFGDVPYVETPIESAEVLDTTGRSQKSEIYDHIIGDLIFAKNNLPPRNTADARSIGTQGSAATVLADVYLTLQQFGDAASEARFVINNANNFNYRLTDNYQDLFNANLAGTLEEPIFTLDLKNDLNDGPYNQNDGMINLTRVRDLAPRSLSVAVPSLEVYNSWDGRDYRRKVSFEDSVLIDDEKIALTDADVRIPRPHIAKYFRYPGPQEAGDDRSSDHHYSMYRYADILLIAAEAIAESEGATTEAISYVNQIRERARFNGNTYTDYPPDIDSGISKGDFIELIREERRLEFAFEFKRWFDIKRWGILEEAFEGPDALEPHTVDPSRDYLFPLPQSEIDVTGFDQNPGY